MIDKSLLVAVWMPVFDTDTAILALHNHTSVPNDDFESMAQVHEHFSKGLVPIPVEGAFDILYFIDCIFALCVEELVL